MTGLRGWIAPALGLTTLIGLQAQLQQALRHDNEVRGARRLQAAPSSLAFRLAFGGVREAAADALWLTVLPKLGQPWVDTAKKAAWIEASTNVMIDADPRALTPVLYGSKFLELIDKRHPGIERLIVRAMDAQERPPFGERRKANAERWELPHEIGMNLYLWGGPAGEERALAYLRDAAGKPDCPGLILDFLRAQGVRRGDPLEGWTLFLMQAALTKNRTWREYYLSQADRARLDALGACARAAEARGGRYPRTLHEVLDAAPDSVKDLLRGRPAVREDLLRDVEILPDIRYLRIPSYEERLLENQRDEIRQYLTHYELTEGKRAVRIADLDAFSHRPLDRPPRPGTRWELDAAGEPAVVPDLADPRRGR